MIELNGKFANAKIFTDLVDQASISQVIELLNQPFVEGSKIRMMPDIHAGAGCTIGATMSVGDKICANLVGVDIGCGMLCVQIKDKYIDFDRLDEVIRKYVPSGFAIRSKPHKFADQIDLAKLRCADHVDLDRAYKSIGTLGGGNHFIELSKDDEDNYYLIVHSGSRHLGLEVAKYYQNLGYAKLNGHDDVAIQQLIDELKAAGRHKNIEDEITKLKNTKRTHIPKDLAYIEGQDFEDYIHDMRILQRYATLNRGAMIDTILVGMRWTAVNWFETIHNYIDLDNPHGMILRKGAVSAEEGQRLLIPMNMRDGCLICVGKGNPDWNYSAPHGAGRIMSRSQAKRAFTVEEFAESMKGIYSTCVGRDTLDEAPMVYKPMESIIENIGDTVEIEKIIKPVYNFKASGD